MTQKAGDKIAGGSCICFIIESNQIKLLAGKSKKKGIYRQGEAWQGKT